MTHISSTQLVSSNQYLPSEDLGNNLFRLLNQLHQTKPSLPTKCNSLRRPGVGPMLWVIGQSTGRALVGISLPTGVLTISLSSAMTQARHRPPRLLAPWLSHLTASLALLSKFPKPVLFSPAHCDYAILPTMLFASDYYALPMLPSSYPAH